MKMLKIARLTLLSFLFLCLALFAAETARVTNLTATPRAPWNGLVDITYSLECDTPYAAMTVSFQGFDYDRNESIPMTTLTGDGADGKLLLAGGPYHIVWDSANDWPEGHSSELTVTATAEVKEQTVDFTSDYLVVDLNTGAVTSSSTGPDLSDDTCRTTELWLRRIPKGTFTMGSPEGEVGRKPNETLHRVTLTEDFYIGVFEMTQKQYSLIYGSNPSYYKGDTRPVENVSYDTIRGTGSTAGNGWPTYGHAVDNDSFLGKLRAKTGLTFDLPTEAQWEYACRAGTTTALNTGSILTSPEQDPAMDEAGRYYHNQNDGKGGYSTEHTRVGSYFSNAWGLYDMHGNVSEWCLDWYDNLDASAVTNPTGYWGTDRYIHVKRGGCWGSAAYGCRSALRSWREPSASNDRHGFRIVLLPHNPDYLVIDLNTGAVTPSSTGPDLSDNACRTSELWLRRIPKGSFIMGSPNTEIGRQTNETQHQVTLTEDFYIGVFEITQKQYSLIYGSNPSKYYGDTRPVESVSYDTIRGTESTAGAGWPNYGHAVDNGSFLGKLRAKTGLTFDLPTEAQWEYACRAGTTTAINTGKNLMSTRQDPAMDEAGRYYYNQNDGKGGYSSNHTSVGSYLPNAWGLYDMHGNVSEWCLDWYQEDLSSSAVTDHKGPSSGNSRVFCDGNFDSYATGCRSATRGGVDPPRGIFSVGFRVVLLLTEEEENPEPWPEPDFTSDYLVVNLNTGAVTSSTTGPDLSDDTCRTSELWLRRIPKGTFTMGSPEGEVGREPGSSKETQHQVTLTEDFYIGVFEITQKQYSLIYGSNPSYYKGDTRPVGYISYDTIRGTGSTAGAGWPACSNAVDSDSFLGKLRAKTGQTFDLPTEAQWEYACRAGTTTALNTGGILTSPEQDPAMDEAGRYYYNHNDGKGGYSEHTKEGSYPPNAWGLYDMHGNVYEWCLDWWKEDLGSSAVTDPMGPPSGSARVLRGGGWGSDARSCRSASRGSSSTPSDNNYCGGFRVVLLPQKPEYLVVDLNTGAVIPSTTGPDLSDDTCRTTELWLRRIPKGTFTMGSPEGEVGRGDGGYNETQHQVTLTEDFYIGVFEITQKQYAIICGNNPSEYKGDTRPVDNVSYDTIRGTGSTAGAGWPTYGHAVDSGSFLGKLRAKTDRTFDLPTEAQWEYACRAGTTTALNTGKNLTSTYGDSAMDEAGRYDNNRPIIINYYEQHAKVGSYLPNAWGLYDMHGNVYEWCLDWLSELGSTGVTDPKGPDAGARRAMRGGCWSSSAMNCRSAHRCYYLSPANPDVIFDRHGFRVVLLP